MLTCTLETLSGLGRRGRGGAGYLNINNDPSSADDLPQVLRASVSCGRREREEPKVRAKYKVVG
jgi:hypothetical protein